MLHTRAVQVGFQRLLRVNVLRRALSDSWRGPFFNLLNRLDLSCRVFLPPNVQFPVCEGDLGFPFAGRSIDVHSHGQLALRLANLRIVRVDPDQFTRE